MSKLSAYVVRAYRQVLGLQNRKDSCHSTDQEVFAAFPLIEASVFLRIARLRHFQKLFVDGPKELLRVLHMEVDVVSDPWLHLVAQDL